MTALRSNTDPNSLDSFPTKRAVLYLRVSTVEQAQRGGEAEGFSIPAQREAGLRKADQMGAVVTETFIDAGESARSVKRPSLQRMLMYLRTERIDYVIVHKVDRLARNRADDVEINLAIRSAGAALVSCTENIDQTPSGTLLHGIMSSLAEFYSQNLAAEVIKGTQQKVKNGGTPSLAPLGYLNVRQIRDGREVRTVELDPDRAELILWAFETYATGDWTLRSLATELEVRGLTTRATPKRVAQPLPPNKLHELLRNRYYIGYVTWGGTEHEGKHPVLIKPAVFYRVQDILAAHAASGERSHKHKPYLAGSLFCQRCDSKLIYAVSTGRRGDTYAYWFCLGRHTGRTSCDLPYIPADRVERVVEQLWRAESVSPNTVRTLQSDLIADLAAHTSEVTSGIRRLADKAARIQQDRQKWAEHAFEGTVPPDIAASKQTQLAQQLAGIEMRLADLKLLGATHEDGIRRAMTLIADCGQAYQQAPEVTRRAFNQGWFGRIELDYNDDEVAARPVRTETAEAIHDATKQLSQARRKAPETEKARDRCSHRVLSYARGSNVACLVELRGFEPLAPSMRTRCATGLRHSPQPVCKVTSVPAAHRTGPPPRSHRPAHRPLVELLFDVEAGQVDGVGHSTQLDVLVIDPHHGRRLGLVGHVFGDVVAMPGLHARSLQPGLTPLPVPQRLIAQEQQVAGQRQREDDPDRHRQRAARGNGPQQAQHSACGEQDQRSPAARHHLAPGLGQVRLGDSIGVHSGLHSGGHRPATGRSP
jgi:site-specific DNA recombinase